MEYKRWVIHKLFTYFCDDHDIQFSRMTEEQFRYWKDRFDLYFQDAFDMAFKDVVEEFRAHPGLKK